MQRADEVRDKDKTACQQPHDHEIARKAVHGHPRELLDTGSDLVLVEELSDLPFGHASLRFPYGLSLTHSKMCCFRRQCWARPDYSSQAGACDFSKPTPAMTDPMLQLGRLVTCGRKGRGGQA